jgi:hypothetical protein
LYLGIAADRAGHGTGVNLFTERVGIPEPAFEDMLVAAAYVEYNHTPEIKVDWAFAKAYFLLILQ